MRLSAHQHPQTQIYESGLAKDCVLPSKPLASLKLKSRYVCMWTRCASGQGITPPKWHLGLLILRRRNSRRQKSSRVTPASPTFTHLPGETSPLCTRRETFSSPEAACSGPRSKPQPGFAIYSPRPTPAPGQSFKSSLLLSLKGIKLPTLVAAGLFSGDESRVRAEIQ